MQAWHVQHCRTHVQLLFRNFKYAGGHQSFEMHAHTPLHTLGGLRLQSIMAALPNVQALQDPLQKLENVSNSTSSKRASSYRDAVVI